MASLISDDQSSIISTDASNTTELSRLFCMSGANPQSPGSTHEDTTDDVDDAYKGINWSKLEGYTKAPHSKRQHISWTWEHGYRIQNMNSQALPCLCMHCPLSPALCSRCGLKHALLPRRPHPCPHHRLESCLLCPQRQAYWHFIFSPPTEIFRLKPQLTTSTLC